MKFKMPGEHRFDQVTYNGEIHVHMISDKNAGNLNSQLAKIFKPEDSLIYKQFAKGFNTDDAAAVDLMIDELTDFIMVIPIQIDVKMTSPNLFLHYLNHEDWLEAAPLG